MGYSCCPRGQLRAGCKTVHNINKVRITRNITEFVYTFLHKMPWLGCKLCVFFVLDFIYTFDTMLVDFLNIKHFSSSEDVKCVCEYCTLIKRQFICDIDF